MFATLRTTGLATLAVLALSGAVSAQSLPAHDYNRDLIRRAILDNCVYGESAREGIKKERVVDACQCAATRALKGVKDDEMKQAVSAQTVPDAWYNAATEAFEGCKR